MFYGIVLAVPLVIVIGATLFLAIRFGIAAEKFFEYIEKLTLAGNRDRALKLCSAAGQLPVSVVVRKGLQLRLPGKFASEEALADAAVDTLMPEAEAQSRRFMPLSAVAVIGVLGAFVIPFLPEVPVGAKIGTAVVLLAGSVNIVRLAFKIRRDVYAAVGVVAPFALGDVASDGRSEEE